MNIFCVSHKSPVFEVDFNYTHFTSKDYGRKNQVIIPEDFYGEAFHGDILSEYTQLFGLADYLKDNANPTDLIYIFQYRKFITTKKANQVSTNLPYAHAYSPIDAGKVFPSAADLSKVSGLLVGPIVKCKSIAIQYAHAHHIEDYCKFFCSLSLSDEFGTERCSNFADSKLLIPAPSLGITQVALFISHMNILKKIWLHFFNSFYVKRHGIQRRVGGFLLERLHSFLIIEEIYKRKFNIATGKQIVVSNSMHITPSM